MYGEAPPPKVNQSLDLGGLKGSLSNRFKEGAYINQNKGQDYFRKNTAQQN